MSKRVVVTGLGVTSPAGCNIQELWTNVLRGTSFITRKSYEQYKKIPSKVAAVISPDELDFLVTSSNITESKLRSISRSTCLALLAAHQAILNANLHNCNAKLKENVGVAIGSGMSDFMDIYESKDNLDQGYNRVSPYFIPRVLLNMSAGNLSIDYGFRGPNHCVTTACATGTHSIGDSFKMIQNGMAVAMVCGGTEACVNPLTMAGFSRMRALSCNFNDTPKLASRPFDKKRDGFVIGEGAAVLVLEELEHAVARNVNIYGEVLGYGMCGDAFNLTTPSENGEGAVLSMRRSLEDAKTIKVDDVTYVNAHATSTPAGDAAELKAIAKLFEKSSQSVFVSSMKGCYGHLLGAAGSIEVICTILACHYGWIPPTANLTTCIPHPDNIVCNSMKQRWPGMSRRIALKNSFGFGGTNASLCVGDFQK